MRIQGAVAERGESGGAAPEGRKKRCVTNQKGREKEVRRKKGERGGEKDTDAIEVADARLSVGKGRRH